MWLYSLHQVVEVFERDVDDPRERRTGGREPQFRELGPQHTGPHRRLIAGTLDEIGSHLHALDGPSGREFELLRRDQHCDANRALDPGLRDAEWYLTTA